MKRATLQRHAKFIEQSIDVDRLGYRHVIRALRKKTRVKVSHSTLYRFMCVLRRERDANSAQVRIPPQKPSTSPSVPLAGVRRAGQAPTLQQRADEAFSKTSPIGLGLTKDQSERGTK